jgi:tRNA (guanine-N7-)-methyltransferase
MSEDLKTSHIRSFVRRQRSLTIKQNKIWEQLHSTFILPTDQGIVDFKKIFSTDKPFILEIGFGMGESFIQMAKNEPTHHFIGIEVHKPGVGKILEAIHKDSIQNIRIFYEDATHVLQYAIADESLDRIQIYFPDPWPKRRHHKRRLIQKNFITLLQTKLKKEGLLHLVTDDYNYAKHMLKTVETIPSFHHLVNSQQPFAPRPIWRPMTKFEKRAIQLGHPIFELLLQR